MFEFAEGKFSHKITHKRSDSDSPWKFHYDVILARILTGILTVFLVAVMFIRQILSYVKSNCRKRKIVDEGCGKLPKYLFRYPVFQVWNQFEQLGDFLEINLN